ncbi:MAG TPA: methylenetetrahydrofolate reductase [Microbacteriaceae bacterium]|nr:methylenetetrahydrofolate reductase [Microbacteriaceae bacterium]
MTARVDVGFSFELYPPRSAQVAARMPQIVRALAETAPRFISVTYAASGASRDASRAVLAEVRASGARPMAHLTCVRSSFDAAHRLVRRFLDDGITDFLAVRGDPPADGVGDGLGEIRSAAELVQLIHRVHAERVPYDEVPVPGLPGAARVGRRSDEVHIAVAAFPGGHPASRSLAQDVDTLLAKEAAGATLALTQLFFHADDYFRLVERARAGGVRMPIVPGIMPVTSPARLARMLELSGQPEPYELAIALEVEPSVEGRRAIGIGHAARLARTLIEGGAPGIHLYTFNREHTALAVLREAGLVGDAHRPAARIGPQRIPNLVPNLPQEGES